MDERQNWSHSPSSDRTDTSNSSLDSIGFVQSAHVSYGIDSPAVILKFGLGAALSVVLGIVLYFAVPNNHGLQTALLVVFLLTAGVCVCIIVGMYWSSIFGKFQLREKLLAQLSLSGDEKIIDIGCGRGFLLIALAKRLTSDKGRAFGVDIFDKWSQTENKPANTIKNSEMEGVGQLCEVLVGDIGVRIPLEDRMFDVVVSSLVFHLLPRHQLPVSIGEVRRLIKPSGSIMFINVFWVTERVESLLVNEGFEDVTNAGLNFSVFPPVKITFAKAPPERVDSTK